MVWKRLLARALGGEIEPGLRPVLVTLGLSMAGMYMFWSLFSLWAIERLALAKGDIGLALMVAALIGMSGGLLGGSLSDRLGRRPVILVAASFQALLPSLLLLPGLPVWGALAVLVGFAFAQPVRGGAQMALVADLIPPERRTAAFGTFRVVFNAGALLGPLAAAGLVTLSWEAWNVGVCLTLALSLLAATRLPEGRRPTVAEHAAGPRFRAIVAAPVFLALFTAGLLASVTYNAFETLLPVSLTQEHGYAKQAWGVLFAINPVLVLLLQLRVTRWSEPLAPALRLSLAMLLMGASFLLLLVTAAPAALVVILAVFVLGEMLWAPNADALTARAAPESARGRFLGAIGISTWIGGALAPAIGLQIAEVSDGAMWLAIAAISAAAAAAYVVAQRVADGVETRAGPAPEPAA